MRRSEDIHVRAEASVIGRKRSRRGRSQEDDHSLTFDSNEFGVPEPNSAEIGLAVFEKRSNRQTHRQTDRHLCFIYILPTYLIQTTFLITQASKQSNG